MRIFVKNSQKGALLAQKGRPGNPWLLKTIVVIDFAKTGQN